MSDRIPPSPDAARDLGGWLAELERRHPRNIELGLERVSAVLAALDLADPPYVRVTVGGTNGKGSTVAMLAALLAADSKRIVGAYTSPHLWCYNERIRIAGANARDEQLIEWIAEIEAAPGAERLTYFEFTTALALTGFARSGVEIAVLEVGLGGRLDAVNAVDPDVAVLTSVDLDHQAWLGPDRESIGREKAGIFRAGRPAVLGDPDPPRSVLTAAAAAGATLYRHGKDFSVEDCGDHLRYEGLWCELPELPRTRLTANAAGCNLACALAALECLDPGRLPDLEVLRAALADCHPHGRFQQATIAGVRWVLDVAHNPAAARALAAALAEEVPRRSVAVVGMLRDKDVEGVAGALAGRFAAWIAVGLGTERGLAAGRLAERLTAGGAWPVYVEPDVEQGCARAARLLAAGDQAVVFGSFHTVAPAARCLGLYSAAFGSPRDHGAAV